MPPYNSSPKAGHPKPRLLQGDAVTLSISSHNSLRVLLGELGSVHISLCLLGSNSLDSTTQGSETLREKQVWIFICHGWSLTTQLLA